MEPFEDRLRRWAEGIEITVADTFAPHVVRQALRLRRRRRAGLTGAFLGALTVALVGAFLVLPGQQRTHTLTVGQKSTGTSAAQAATSTAQASNGVIVLLHLASTTVTAGTAITGELRITNPTGHRITVPLGCPTEVYQVALSSRHDPAEVGWLQVGCRPPFTVATGQNRYPVVVDTGSVAPGAYTARLYVRGLPVPIPPAIAVTITAGPSTPAGIVRSACTGVRQLFSGHTYATAIEMQTGSYQRQIAVLARHDPAYRALASAVSSLGNLLSRAVPGLRYVVSAHLPSPLAVETACARLSAVDTGPAGTVRDHGPARTGGTTVYPSFGITLTAPRDVQGPVAADATSRSAVGTSLLSQGIASSLIATAPPGTAPSIERRTVTQDDLSQPTRSPTSFQAWVVTYPDTTVVSYGPKGGHGKCPFVAILDVSTSHRVDYFQCR